jgi:hypothetical protein
MTLDLDDPVAVLLAAATALDRAGIQALAYGGLVLAMYGEPRETRDADLAVASVDVEVAKRAVEAADLTVFVAFADVRFGGNMVSRMTVAGGGKLNTVDLVRPRSPRYAAAMLQRGLRGSLRGEQLTTVSPEDFVLLKALSTRERDLDDARSVVESLTGRLDRALIDREIAALATEISDHACLDRYRRIMA